MRIGSTKSGRIMVVIAVARPARHRLRQRRQHLARRDGPAARQH